MSLVLFFITTVINYQTLSSLKQHLLISQFLVSQKSRYSVAYLVLCLGYNEAKIKVSARLHSLLEALGKNILKSCWQNFILCGYKTWDSHFFTGCQMGVSQQSKATCSPWHVATFVFKCQRPIEFFSCSAFCWFILLLHLSDINQRILSAFKGSCDRLGSYE